MTYRLQLPLKNEEVLDKLKVGDVVYVDGIVVTLRDLGHRRVLNLVREGKPLPIDFRGIAVFHAGPIATRIDDKWKIVSIGPTTSARMDLYVYDLVKYTEIKVIIGKGGMGSNARKACKDFKAVYLELVGGTASLITKAIVDVLQVHWLDLGIPEALWVLKVENLGPAIVVIDTRGLDLHEEVMQNAHHRYKNLISP